jgi:hypothetical protein
LSATDAAKVAIASQCPDAVNNSCGGGQVMAGFSRSWTVTVKLQRLVFPLVSVPTQLTVVSPLGKVAPEAGVQTTLALQLSVTVDT